VKALLAMYVNEIKRTLTYRVEFWIGSILQALIFLYSAVALWSAVFTSTDSAQSIGGLSLSQMTAYYALAACLYYVIYPGEMGFMSEEIYQGQLNRYLVYPIPYLRLKLSVYLAQATLFFGQSIVIGLILQFGFAIPLISSWSHLAMGLTAVMLACAIAFHIVAVLQMSAFWLDQAWSVMVMFYMTLNFLGGRVVPLTIFPNWLRSSLEWLPFSSVMSFPVQAFRGGLSHDAFVFEVIKGFFWLLFFIWLSRSVFERGLRRYGGVGI